MQSSARNQFKGTVREVLIGAVNAEVHIELPGGATIIAAITKTSAENMAITAGMLVVALVKAPQVMIVADFGGYKLSACNQLSGTVAAIKQGAVNAEVAIELAGGQQVFAIVTHESIQNLGLKTGQSATAIFKAGAVILAVPA